MKPRVYLPAVVSGLLLWAAFFPLNLGPVGFVALAPWLTLVRAPTTRRRRYAAAFLGGFTFFGVALNWLPAAHPMMYASWACLAVVCPLFWCLALFLARRIDRVPGVPLALSAAAAWVAAEYLRAHFPTGYPFLKPLGLYHMVGFNWYFVGYTQHDFVPLLQVADLGGVYAVTFLVVAVNGLLSEWLTRSPAVRRWLRWESAPRVPLVRLVPATAGVAALMAAAVGYGLVRLSHAPFRDGPRVAAIQGSVPQFEKNTSGVSLGKTYYGLAKRAANLDPRPDLIVWPETCCPFAWYQISPDADPKAAGKEFQSEGGLEVGSIYQYHPPVPSLYGLTAMVWEGDNRPWKYNSAVLLGPGREFLGRYDKMHLIPFGEYVPFRETLPFMSWFTPYKWEYSCRPGEHWTRFPVRAANNDLFRFGCLICYEDSDPYLARQYAGPVDPVDFLVNISNDGWFDGTEEHEQHLAVCRFRAVEARRSVVRAVNMGVSGVVDPDGRVVALPADTWGGSKKVEGVVSAVVPVDDRLTWYARFGDWLPAACGVAAGLGVAWSLVARRRAA